MRVYIHSIRTCWHFIHNTLIWFFFSEKRKHVGTQRCRKILNRRILNTRSNVQFFFQPQVNQSLWKWEYVIRKTWDVKVRVYVSTQHIYIHTNKQIYIHIYCRSQYHTPLHHANQVSFTQRCHLWWFIVLNDVKYRLLSLSLPHSEPSHGAQTHKAYL
jgi:hypothetical protein